MWELREACGLSSMNVFYAVYIYELAHEITSDNEGSGECETRTMIFKKISGGD